MTRKDYILIAGVISNVKAGAARNLTGETRAAADDAIEAVAARLAAKLAKDNPRFDVDKFIEACK
jgi:hypothetical protein